jgi:hypothetical protein
MVELLPNSASVVGSLGSKAIVKSYQVRPSFAVTYAGNHKIPRGVCTVQMDNIGPRNTFVQECVQRVTPSGKRVNNEAVPRYCFALTLDGRCLADYADLASEAATVFCQASYYLVNPIWAIFVRFTKDEVQHFH